MIDPEQHVNASEPSQFAGFWRGRLASHARMAPLLLGAAATASCLVTDKAEFPFANSPPVITQLDPDLLTHIPPTVPTSCSSMFARDARVLALTLDVRDPDLDDNVDVRIFLNRNRASTIFSTTLPVNGHADRASASICLDASAQIFSRACNLIEVRVSRDFREDRRDQPKTPGDLAIAPLLVLPAVADLPSASSADCDALLAELASESDGGTAP